MELHQLRYATAVARMGNFSRAAEDCHVSQPSLSQQIQKLEGELGERLFDRMKREARVTAYGEVFLRRAQRVLDEVDAAKREASEAKDLLMGKLTLGILPTMAPYLLPRVMVRFLKDFPGVEVVVQEDTTERLLKQALAFEIDFAIVSEPIRDQRLEVRRLFTEELWLALPPKHPLTRQAAVSLDDVDDEPMIVMREGHCLGEQVMGFCDRGNIRPRITFQSAQLETVQAMVRAGLGVSLIPAMALRRNQVDSPEYRPLKSPRPKRSITAVWLKSRRLTRAAGEFIERVSD